MDSEYYEDNDIEALRDWGRRQEARRHEEQEAVKELLELGAFDEDGAPAMQESAEEKAVSPRSLRRGKKETKTVAALRRAKEVAATVRAPQQPSLVVPRSIDNGGEGRGPDAASKIS